MRLEQGINTERQRKVPHVPSALFFYLAKSQNFHYQSFLQNSVSADLRSDAEVLAIFRGSSFKTEVLKEVRYIP
jgi:hypothetical protein